MNTTEPSTLHQEDPCSRQRITYENCLRLRLFDSKCFLDHVEYKDCILLHSKREEKKIETPGTLGAVTRTNANR